MFRRLKNKQVYRSQESTKRELKELALKASLEAEKYKKMYIDSVDDYAHFVSELIDIIEGDGHCVAELKLKQRKLLR